MSEIVPIQWFPGHMAKTRRMLTESVRLVDCVAELIAARIPYSSRNPELDTLCAGKPRVVLLCKSTLADEAATKQWVAALRAEGAFALAIDSKTGEGVSAFRPLLQKLLREKLEHLRERGMQGKALRVLVAGVPNVGKSTFINRLAGERRAKAEDRPGVTRGNQWISLGSGLELLDTPGILWPKFEDPAVGERLAFTGAVRDEVIDTTRLGARLCELLAQSHPKLLAARYKLEGELPADGDALLERIARRRGLLVSGGEADVERAAILVLDEFRGGRIGRITLELPGRPEEA